MTLEKARIRFKASGVPILMGVGDASPQELDYLRTYAAKIHLNIIASCSHENVVDDFILGLWRCKNCMKAFTLKEAKKLNAKANS